MLPANRFFLVFLCFFSITCAQKPSQGVSIDFLKPIHNKHTVAAGTGVLLFVVACCVGIQMNRLYKKIKRLKESVKEALQNLGHETDADTTEDALIALLPEQTKQLADKVDEKDKTNPYKKKYNDLRDTVQKALQNLGKSTDRLTEEELKKQLPEQTKQLASELLNQGDQHNKLLREKQQHFLKKEKMYKESIQQLKTRNIETVNENSRLKEMNKQLKQVGGRLQRHMNAIASEYLQVIGETDPDAVQIKNQEETTLDEFSDILDRVVQMRLSNKDLISGKSSVSGQRDKKKKKPPTINKNEKGFPRLQRHMNLLATEYLRAVSETDKSFVQIKNQNKTTPEEFSDILDQVTQIKLRDKTLLYL